MPQDYSEAITPQSLDLPPYILSKSVLEIFPSAAAIADIETNTIQLFNSKAVRLWGKEPLPGQPRHDFYSGFSFYDLDGSEISYQQTPIEQVRRTRETVLNKEFIVRRPDGKKAHILMSAHVIADSRGTQRGILTIFEDVAQNHRMNVSSHDGGKFRLPAKNTNEAVWDLHIATDHMDWNKSITSLYGYKQREVELTGSWWLHNIHPSDQAKVKESMERTLRSSEVAWHCEYRFRRADGTYAPTIDRGYVMRTENGTPVRMIGAMQDMSKNVEQAEEWRRQALYDTLTGLPNRKLIEEQLDAVLLAGGEPYAIMFLDVDGFKAINDTHGHDFGDSILKTIAKRLQEGADGAFVGRLAGDEFIVIVQAKSRQDAASIATSLLRAVQKPVNLQRKKLHISISLGITMHPQDGANISGLLKNADRALYKAKHTGKGKYMFYT